MATSTSTTPKLTTCSICFETFKVPRSLPCLHTFCEECITKYILSVLSKEEAPTGKINCPICRMTVEKPEGVDKSEWGKKLPYNHLMDSILDCESIKEGKICDACERENETESAVHWCFECRDSLCEKCAAGHKKYRISKDHKMVRLIDLDEASLTSFDNSCCSKHPEKKLEAFCSDHNVACCITCVTLEHRKCEHVGTIESAAEKIRKSTALADLEKELTEIDDLLADKVKNKEQNIADLGETCSNIRDEVKSVRTRINAHLDEIEKNALQELSATEKEVFPKLENERDSLESQRTIVSNCLDIVRAGLKYASHTHLLIEFEKLKLRKAALDKFLSEESDDRTLEVSFETSEELQQIQKIKSFGRIHRSDSAPNINMLQGTASVVQTINTSHGGFFTGGLIMENNSVLIAQFSAKKLELYGATGNFLSEIQLGRSAWSVETTGKGKGVVTVYDTKTLVFFDVVDGTRLSETGRKDLGVMCYDVRLFNGKLYVACNTEIKILDLSGDEVGKIAPLTSQARFLDISPESKTLCYSSNSYNVLTCIDLTGKQIFQYSSPDLKTASGVSFDFAGNIYVVGYSSGNVHQLNKLGQLNKIIVDELTYPNAMLTLRFKENSNLFLTNSMGQARIYEIV